MFLSVRQRLVPKTFLFKRIPDPAIVNTRELGASGGHVDVERFALRTLLVQELVHRIVNRFQLEQDGHDDKQSLAQVRRTAFADSALIGHFGTRIVPARVNTRSEERRVGKECL